MFKISTRYFLSLILFCLPNSLLSIGILVIMNNVISGKVLFFKENQGIFFFTMVIISFFLNVLFQKKIIAFSNKLIYENELRVMEKFLASSPSQLEKIGAQRIYGAVEDMRMLIFLPGMVATAITLFLTLIICFFYFLLLSLPSTIFVIGLIAIIIYVYLSVNKSLAGSMHQIRELNDNYFKLIDDILKGFRELKLSAIRRINLHERFLRPNRAAARDTEIYVSNYLSIINLISQYGLYLIIGAVIFILPMLKLLNKEEISSFVVILLFIRGPINALTSMQAFFTKAFAANKRITTFLMELDVLSVEDKKEDIHIDSIYEHVNELRFENIGYKYTNTSREDRFALRTVNLTIREGEVIFIIGGNGSGKSTFINILTGIYSPVEGEVFLDDKPIANNLQHYRNHISAIYSDNHLFSGNYEDYSLKDNETYKSLLKIMELNAIVTDDDDSSARQKFSKGQGKRMALIFALLEKKPFLILDEWAADQDPHFRKYFYEVLIPKLRQEGKTVIAVTHDDAYFHYADRIIKFEYGQIVKDVQVNNITSLWE